MRQRVSIALFSLYFLGLSSATSYSTELRTYRFADVGRSFHTTCGECTLNDFATVVGTFDLAIDHDLNSVAITRFDATLIDPIREMSFGAPAHWINGANLGDLLPGDVTTAIGHFANPGLVEFEPVETPHPNPTQAYTTRFSLLFNGDDVAFTLASTPHVDPDGPLYYFVNDLQAELIPEPSTMLLFLLMTAVSWPFAPTLRFHCR